MVVVVVVVVVVVTAASVKQKISNMSWCKCCDVFVGCNQDLNIAFLVDEMCNNQ